MLNCLNVGNFILFIIKSLNIEPINQHKLKIDILGYVRDVKTPEFEAIQFSSFFLSELFQDSPKFDAGFITDFERCMSII